MQERAAAGTGRRDRRRTRENVPFEMLVPGEGLAAIGTEDHGE